jgi:polysaccharide transporter, PST family
MEQRMSGVRRYVSNVLGLALLQGMSFLVPIVMIPVIVRVEGIEEYGRYALVMTFYGFAATLCDYGFDFSAVRSLREKGGAIEARRRIIREAMSAKLLLFLACAPVAALALAGFAGIEDAGLVMAGLLVPAASAVSVHWLYLADGKLLQLSIPVAAARVASMIVVLLVYPFWKSTAFVVAVSAALPMLVQLAFWRVRREEGLHPGGLSLHSAIQGLRQGSTAGSMSLVSSYLAMSSVLVAPMVLSPREIGVFAAIERLARGGFGVTKPFLGALYPEMSSLFLQAKHSWVLGIRNVVLAAAGLGGAAFLLIAIAWPVLSQLLFAQSVEEGRWIAYGFAAWLTIGVMNNGLGIQGLVASGGEAAYRRGLSVAAGVLTAGYAALAARGATGLLAAMILAELTLLALNCNALRKVALHRAA